LWCGLPELLATPVTVDEAGAEDAEPEAVLTTVVTETEADGVTVAVAVTVADAEAEPADVAAVPVAEERPVAALPSPEMGNWRL
jgi:hypothetical protein